MFRATSVIGLLIGNALFSYGVSNATPVGSSNVLSADSLKSAGLADLTGIGHVYTTQGSTTSGPKDVSSGHLIFSNVPAGSSVQADLGSLSDINVYVQDSVTVPSNSGVYHAIYGRRQADGSRYRGRLHMSDDGNVTVSVERVNRSVGLILADVKLPIRVQPGDSLNLALEITQTAPVIISAKAWRSDAAAPGWQAVARDQSTSRVVNTGSVGIWNYVSRSSVATTFITDAFSASGPRGLAGPVPPQAGPTPPVPPSPPTASPAQGGFVHPGVLVGVNQLNYVRAQIASGRQPWKSFYGQLMSSRSSLGSQPNTPFTSTNYIPHPVADVNCGAGPASSAPVACVDEKNDAIAAYANALMWYYSVDKNREAYAQKAVQILNAWSERLTRHSGSNAPLQASWAGSVFPRAAEIIRYTYQPSPGKVGLDVPRLTRMFKNAFLPDVYQMFPSGSANWLMSMIEATLNIGVFTDDRTIFTTAVARWRAQVPSAIYMSTDKPDGFPKLAGRGYPLPPPGKSWANSNVSTDTMDSYWYRPTRYVSGLEGETCRDFAHAAMGIGAMANVAETARVQGLDLYSEQKGRMATALELNTGWMLSLLAGQRPTNWPCSGTSNPVTSVAWKVTYEVAYNEFANRLGMNMPNVAALLTKYSRPASYKADFGFAFEGLTNAGAP